MKVHVDSLEVILCDKLPTSCVLKSAGIRKTAAAPLSSAYCSMMWCVVKGEDCVFVMYRPCEYM